MENRQGAPPQSRPRYTRDEDQAVVRTIIILSSCGYYTREELFKEVRYLMSQDPRFPKRPPDSAYRRFLRLVAMCAFNYEGPLPKYLGLALLLNIHLNEEVARPIREIVPRRLYTSLEDKALVGLAVILCLTGTYKVMELFDKVQQLLNQYSPLPPRPKNSAYNRYRLLAGYVRGYRVTQLNPLGLALLVYYNEVDVPNILRQRLFAIYHIVVGETITDEDFITIQDALNEDARIHAESARPA